MVGKPPQHLHHHHHHAGSSSLGAEEVNLLHMASRGSPADGYGGGSSRSESRTGGTLGQYWKCSSRLRLGLGLGSLLLLRPRRARCVVCLQVQHVAGLPPAAEGRGLVVGWRSKAAGGGGEGEHTAPARVARGAAAFDEVFLQHFTVGGATMRGFTVWAALLDAPADDGDLGAFPVDLAEVAAAAAAAAAETTSSSSNNPSKFGGKALSFPLGGAAAGAVLTVSIYCRVMDQHEDSSHAGASNNNGQARAEKKNKGKAGSSYASCLPDLSCLRNRQVAAAAAAAAGAASGGGGLARRATSIRSDRGGFITIENSMAEMDGIGGGAFGVADVVDEELEEGAAGFITMEKGRVSSRSSSRPLPPNTVVEEEDEEDEKPCLLMELSSEEAAAAAEVEKVEDEFLAMLEDRYWARSKEIEKGLDVGLDLDLDLDLDSLIRDAEMELAKAEQAWKSKVGAAIVEEEEYKELVRRWSASREPSHHHHHHHRSAAATTGCSWGVGFGSPI